MATNTEIFGALMLLQVLAALLFSAPLADGPDVDTSSRYAIIMGANVGNSDEGVLQYATSDARNVASTLQSVAGFARERMVVLTNPSASDVRAQFKKLGMAMRANPTGDKLLFVYYSGHADELSIHLGTSQIAWRDLMALTTSADANARILMVDACRSGELTQVKGNLVTQPFALPMRGGALPQGLAVITSASAGELAQEPPTFRGSFFTHHFLAALRGAGDQNGDGRVTLDEAFNYSSVQALFDTAKTVVGAQHATYRVQLRGRGGLTLASPKSSVNLATLHISDPGDYFLRGGPLNASYIMEVHVPLHGERNVWLPPGDYDVQRRTPSGVYGGDIKLPRNVFTSLNTTQFKAQTPALYAQKGGISGLAPPEPLVSLRLFGVGGTALLSQQNLPWGAGCTLAAKLYTRLWLEVLGEAIVAHGSSGPWRVSQQDVNLAAGLRVTVLQRPRVALHLGAKTGAALFLQQYQGEPAMASGYQVASLTEASASMNVTLHGPLVLTLEMGPRMVYLNLLQSNGESHHRARITGWLRLGLGTSF